VQVLKVNKAHKANLASKALLVLRDAMVWQVPLARLVRMA
jgi:hypothetical protein